MKPLKDSIVALITPFKHNLEVDYNAFEELIKFHLRNNTCGMVVSGTTGESATLTSNEKLKLLEIAVNIVKESESNVPVVFNSGSNNTVESIKLSQEAYKLKADWLMIVAPYYNKPSQEGLYNHFKSIATTVDLPICLYNVPSRTTIDINVNLVGKLSQIPNILAIKDATPCLNRPLEISLKTPSNFTQLSGEDSTIIAYLASGGKGCISVSANVIPKECQFIYDLWNKRDIEIALSEHLKLLSLHKIMFVESNPVPAKYALSLMDKCNPFVRQPLAELTTKNKDRIKKVLQDLKVI